MFSRHLGSERDSVGPRLGGLRGHHPEGGDGQRGQSREHPEAVAGDGREQDHDRRHCQGHLQLLQSSSTSILFRVSVETKD